MTKPDEINLCYYVTVAKELLSQLQDIATENGPYIQIYPDRIEVISQSGTITFCGPILKQEDLDLTL